MRKCAKLRIVEAGQYTGKRKTDGKGAEED